MHGRFLSKIQHLFSRCRHPLKVYHMLTGQPLVPDETAANDGTMLGWLIAMSCHKDYRTTPDTALGMKYFAETRNGTAYSSTCVSGP